MAPGRPSSPTSLLWAHQLKREHGHLLKRMQDLESANEEQEARIKNAEATAKVNAGNDVAALAKQVKALEQSGIHQRLENVERNVTRKLEDVHAESEAMTSQITALQKKSDRLAEEERKAALNKDKALLKRIGEVEAELRKYEGSLEAMGKGFDESRFEQIQAQLEGLTKRVEEGGEQMRLLTESVAALEAANLELKKANEGLERKFRRQPDSASRSAEAVGEDAAGVAQTEPHKSPEESSPKRKKSHKWSGGGADREIISMGSGLFGTATAPAKKAVLTKLPDASTEKKPAPKKRPVAKKVPIPKTTFTPGEKKAHEWSCGDADRAIIREGLTQDPISKRSELGDEEHEESKTRKTRRRSGGGADRDIIRAGKGWYEIAETPHEEVQEPNETTKRADRAQKDSSKVKPEVQDSSKRGRVKPPKIPSLRVSEAELVSQAPESRRTRQQKQANVMSTKRKAHSSLDDAVKEDQGPTSKKLKPTTRAAAKPKKGVKPEPNVYSSPVSSRASPEVDGRRPARNTNKGAAQPKKAAPRIKREILQSDDDDMSAILKQMKE